MGAEAKRGRATLARLGCALSLLLFTLMLLGNLSHPLLWQDEAETAMFAKRVLEYGYPKVHGPRNVIYQFGFDMAMGVKEASDAYIGTTWGHFYFATIGVALAEQSDDLYEQTLCLRLPFALTGAAGVLLLLLVLLPPVSGARGRLAFACAYLLLSSASVALLLHLREVRYYSLVTLLASLLCGAHLLYWTFGRIGYRTYFVLTSSLLLLLYHTFFVAFFVFLIALAVDRLLALRWTVGADPPRGRILTRAAAPLLAAAVMAAPFLVFYETLSTARAFAQHLKLTPEVYARNLVAIFGYGLRFEFLLPALVVTGARLLLSRDVRATPSASERQAAEVSRLLALVVLANAFIHALNPLLYGRYFAVLSPLLTGLFLMESLRLARVLRIRTRTPDARKPVLAALVVSLVALLLALAPKLEDVAGRVRELREPVRGPLDFAIPFLKEHYGDTRSLVIATNYESFPLMLYLGSHVIVGSSGAGLPRDLSEPPDVVLPRKSWPRHLEVLAGFLRRGRYERHDFPVVDDPYNTIPELGRWPSVPVTHRFATALASREVQKLQLFLRADDEGS